MNHKEILSTALAIREEIIQRFPEYTAVLRSAPFRVSTRTSTSLGICRFKGGKPFEIVLSFNAFQHDANASEFRDIVLHEMAHAIAGIRAGHGFAWQVVARRIGARTERTCGTLAISPVTLVSVACYVCNGDLKVTKHRAARVRNGTQRYRHNRCMPKTPLSLLRSILP